VLPVAGEMSGTETVEVSTGRWDGRGRGARGRSREKGRRTEAAPVLETDEDDDAWENIDEASLLALEDAELGYIGL
jgi:hypothetical protein